jgi:hypothetical protein
MYAYAVYTQSTRVTSYGVDSNASYTLVKSYHSSCWVDLKHPEFDPLGRVVVLELL